MAMPERLTDWPESTRRDWTTYFDGEIYLFAWHEIDPDGEPDLRDIKNARETFRNQLYGVARHHKMKATVRKTPDGYAVRFVPKEDT